MDRGSIPERFSCERIQEFTPGTFLTNSTSNRLRLARSSSVRTAACLVGLAFAAFYAGTGRGVFVFGDDILMYQVAESIWERGEVSVRSLAPQLDVAQAARGLEGRRFSKYGVAPSLVALPFYGASHRLFDRLELPETSDRFGNLRTGATIFGTGLANAAIGGAAVAVTFLLAVELGFPLLVALSTACTLGAATLMAHYASTFLSEPLSALGLALAMLGLLKAKSQGKSSIKGVVAGRWWLALSGFAAGAVVATKVAHLVMVVPFLIWAGVLGWQRARHRGLVPYSLYWSFSFLLWLGAVAAYNWNRFGSVFETGYGSEAGSFTAPLFLGLGGLLASPAKGIFWYCPVLLLSILGARAFWRRDRACALVILAASAAWLLLISRYYQWFGGGSWGPRFLVPLLTLWILPAAELFARWRRGGKLLQTTAVVLIALSLVVSVAPLLVPFSELDAPLVWSRTEFARAGWRLTESPLLQAIAELPAAVRATTAKLLGRQALGEAGLPASGPRFPDFAFEHYGSHALLVWTRACFLVALLALTLAAALARRPGASRPQDQKALLSRPPQ